MVETVLRSRRRRSDGKVTVAAERYAAMGWPVCLGAYPPGRSQVGRGCSCDRLGCPAPGAHPVSAAWQIEASADTELVSRWWLTAPMANVILVTGRVFDTLDVPARAGMTALASMDRSGVRPGPVALSTGRRALFFVSTRGRPADEDEWWSCHLDSEPEAVEQVAGLRWHCRDSYVLAPPSRFGDGQTARWLREPDGRPLPDGLRLLEYLADACEAAGR